MTVSEAPGVSALQKQPARSKRIPAGMGLLAIGRKCLMTNGRASVISAETFLIWHMTKHSPAVLLVGLLAVSSLHSAEVEPTRWNLLEAGMSGDGKTDCTAALQNLLDQAGKAGGGIVEVPAGRFRINGNLSVPANVTLQGVFRTPPSPSASANGELTGSVLLAYAGRGSNDGPPVHPAGRATMRPSPAWSLTYPEWKQTDVPPVPYPPCVASEDTENVGISDCCLLNPYEAIKLVRAAPAPGAQRHRLPDQARASYVDECYDIGHIENIHFWPFGVAYNPNDPYCKWVNTQGVAFELARTDWHYVLNTFCFGYGVGYKFSESKARQRQRQLPGPGRRLVPAGGAGRAGPAAGAADHQRRVRRPLEQHRLGLPRDRAEGRRQSQPGELLVLGTDRPLRLDAQPLRASSPPAPAISSIGTTGQPVRRPSSSTPARPSCRARLSSAQSWACWWVRMWFPPS